MLTSLFPKDELYGLSSQMRRASISIPSNIAEGWGRNSFKEYAQFYSIAYGSVLELETQLIIAQELQLVSFEISKRIEPILKEVASMLNVMSSNLRKKTERWPLDPEDILC